MQSLQSFLSEKIKPRKKKEIPPAALILKRKTIRQFPDVGDVAMYYAPQLKKHIAIPFSDIAIMSDISEEHEFLYLKEDNINVLEKISDTSKAMNLEFEDGTSMVVDAATANSILSVYSRANQGNKKRMASLLSQDIKSFQKLVKFSLENS